MPDPSQIQGHVHMEHGDQGYHALVNEVESYVVVMRKSHASIALLQDHKELRTGAPYPSITVEGTITNSKGEVMHDGDDHNATISIVLNGPDQAVDLIGHCLTMLLNMDNVKVMLQSIIALADVDQTPVYVASAQAILDDAFPGEEQ